jgi:hypothetical protein
MAPFYEVNLQPSAKHQGLHLGSIVKVGLAHMVAPVGRLQQPFEPEVVHTTAPDPHAVGKLRPVPSVYFLGHVAADNKTN